MKNKTSKSSKTFKLLIPLFLCLALLIGSFLFIHFFRPDLEFLAKNAATTMVSSGSYTLQQKEPEELGITDYSIEELQADSRITFDESLLLINNDFPLAEDYVPAVSLYLDTDVCMNDCIQSAYAALSAAVREQFDIPLYIRSAYRTREEQEAEYDLNTEKAALPGASEHQAGLALDIYVPYFAGQAFIKAPAGQWVYSHCADYGFIIRYPYYGTSETGIRFEPWHIRYIGHPHSDIITGSRTTLEEYVNGLTPGCFYLWDNYLITRQSGNTLKLPTEFASARISEDNQGFRIITVVFR